MSGLYAANGSFNITVVDGSTITGVYAADGSINVVVSGGNAGGKAYHPCGAWYVTEASSGPVPIRAPDGSLYVTTTSNLNQGQRVTVVSGALSGGGGPAAGIPMGLLLALTYAS